MRRSALIALALTAAAAVGQEPDTGPASVLPRPRELVEPRRLVAPVVPPEDERCLPPRVPLEELLQQLRTERQALVADQVPPTPPPREADPAAENAMLRYRINKALARLKAAPPAEVPRSPKVEAPAAPPPAPKPPEPRPPDPRESSAAPTAPRPAEKPAAEAAPSPADPVGLARALFLAGRYAESLEAFRQLDLKGQKAEDRVPVQYLTASCLHRLGKTEEAVALFREVANSRGDEQSAQCAQWRLSVIRWQQEAAGKLNELRERRLRGEQER